MPWPCFGDGTESCWGPDVLSITTVVNAAQFTWSSLLEMPGDIFASVLTREKATLVTSRGGKEEGHWRAGDLIFMKKWSWQLKLYELSCKLSHSSAVPLCHCFSKLPGMALDAHWSRAGCSSGCSVLIVPGFASFRRRVQQSCSFHRW